MSHISSLSFFICYILCASQEIRDTKVRTPKSEVEFSGVTRRECCSHRGHAVLTLLIVGPWCLHGARSWSQNAHAHCCLSGDAANLFAVLTWTK